MSRGLRVALCLALLGVASLAGCGKKKPAVSVPPAPQVTVGAAEEGLASWYGHPYHGRPTTSGEIYDMEKMTAAHRTLPFGTRVSVENLSNGREAEVRINDRGPFVDGRIIDVSHAAARRIQMLGSGTARVRVRVVSLPEAASAGFFAVQVGAFKDRRNAERLQASLAREYRSTFIQEYEDARGVLHRVLVGRVSEAGEAQRLADKLRKRDLVPFVVRVDARL